MAHQQRIIRLPRPSRLSGYIRSYLRPLDVEIDVVRTILAQYGLELTKRPRNMPVGRRNRNLSVETSAGKKLLKGYRPQWQVGTVTFAHSILAHLEHIDFPAPRLVTTPDGETFVNESDRHYALFNFVDGTNYTANFFLRAHRRKLMALAGKTLASFHRQLTGFLPEGHHHLGFRDYTSDRWRDVAWHVEKVQELSEKSSQRTDLEEKYHAGWLIQHSDLLLDELARLDETLRQRQLPRLVIHGDYGLHNLLFLADGTIMPVDFELTRLEWRLSDLVSCLSRLRYSKSRGVAYDFESMRWFMEAYQAEYPLSIDEWHAFPDVWQFYKLRGAVQYWNSYFETNGPLRKLVSARDAIEQVEWTRNHPEKLLELNTVETVRSLA